MLLMIEIERPDIFPECKDCRVAGREIRNFSKIKRVGNIKVEEFTDIIIRCHVRNIFFFRKVTMESIGLVIGKSPKSEDEFIFDANRKQNVSRECPGINK